MNPHAGADPESQHWSAALPVPENAGTARPPWSRGTSPERRWEARRGGRRRRRPTTAGRRWLPCGQVPGSASVCTPALPKGGSGEHGPPRAAQGPGVEVRSQGWTHTREHPRPTTLDPIPPHPHMHCGPEAHQTEGFRKSCLQGTLVCLDIGRPCAKMPKARMRSEGSRAFAHERSSPSGHSTACCRPAPAGGAAPAGPARV